MSNKRVTGVIHVHPRGFGFVTPDDPETCKQTIFIPPGKAQDAVQGDHVEVLLARSPRKPERGPEGRIVKITKRARSQIAGIVQNAQRKKKLIVFSPLLGPDVTILADCKGHKVDYGTRVLLNIKTWKDRKGNIRGEVIKVLGDIENPKIDVNCAIEEFEIEAQFPAAAIKEAKSFGKEVTDTKGRVDFTKDEVFTIDPTTARDFDDALCVTRTKGGYRLCVHIADVPHYVTKGSALDRFAARRCNSVYFPGKCVPMLPEELSNELCSLKEGVKRLTASVIMELDDEGKLKSYDIVKGVIESKKRFTYEEAKQVLDGKLKSPHKASLELMCELCEKLKTLRRARGSVDLALPETVVQVNKSGVPTGFVVVEYDITHQLVEEFMLKANEVVATHLSKKVKESLYRVHQAPTEEEQADFFQFARQLGFKLPSSPTTEQIQEVFEKAQKTPYAHQLAVSFIRTMKLAMYSPENVGHFGLALEHYTHFTSPIRRYPDLIIHRLLFEKSDPEQSLSAIAMSCSDCERKAAKAENHVKLLKKLRHLENNDADEYSATITKVFPPGFAFEVEVYGIEGTVLMKDLQGDFKYDAKRAMHQASHGKRYRLGDKISVCPEHIDLVSCEVTWLLR